MAPKATGSDGRSQGRVCGTRRSRCRGTGRPAAGTTGPTPSRGPPATPARPGRRARARRRRCRAPGRRASGGARRRWPAPSRVHLDVGRAVEVGLLTVRPSGPGSSGNTQRIGWFTANTHRPPGRSTRATSRITRSGSATNGTAPNAEQARSKRAVGERQPLRAGLHQRHADAGRGARAAAAWRSIPPDRSSADRTRPGRGQPPRARRGAAADLQHPRARRRRRAAGRRPPAGPRGTRRSRRRRGRAVLGEVVVGVGVPPRAGSRAATPPRRRGRRATPAVPSTLLGAHPADDSCHRPIVAVRAGRYPHCRADRAPRSMVAQLWSTSRLSRRLRSLRLADSDRIDHPRPVLPSARSMSRG